MITTIQLGARLIRFFKGVTSLGDLPAPETAALVDAINLGLGEFLSFLPAHRLETRAAWLLRAPISQSISIVSGATGFSYNAGSPYPEGGYLSETDALGHAVMVAGDSQLNMLNRSGELLSPYRGTTGDVTMTIYGDAVNLSENDRRLVSNVEVVETTGARTPLQFLNDSNMMPFSAYAGLGSQHTEFGRPNYWFTSGHLGSERTSSPLWHLRLWPIPITEYSVRARILSFPASLTFDDLHVARNLPLKVEEETLLIALIAPGLRTSPFLADHIEKPDLDMGADRARAALAFARSDRQTSQPRRVLTRRGF